MILRSSLLLSIGLLFCCIGCGEDKGKHIPDVSHIKSDVQIQRFEQDLFQLDTTNFALALANLEEEYGDFAQIYFKQILASKDPRVAPDGHEAYVRGFVTFSSVRHLYDTTQVVFQDFDALKADFDQAFQFFQYYFPNRKVPDLTTFISEYTYAAFVYGENSLAVGLDFFLGQDYPYTKYNPANPNFSAYLTRSFNKDHLVMKTLTPMLEDRDFLGFPTGERLLDIMVHNGKKLYIMEHLLPYAPDSVIMEYSQRQVEWVEGNEFQIWSHFLDKELLYSTDFSEIRKLVDYSPHSPGMPPEAPGRTANWIGWQIVKSYMKRYPETTLEQLLRFDNAQQLLDLSKYRPR